MAEFKLNAGAKIDLLNRGEVREELARAVNWMQEIYRGIRVRHGSTYVDVGGAGTVPATYLEGPQSGFTWLLHRLTIAAAYTPASMNLGLYASDDAADSALVVARLTNDNEPKEIVRGGQQLCVAGTGPASTRLWITWMAWEAPQPLEWKLLS